jgi:hypothetical protein
VTEAMTILTSLIKVMASPGGEAALSAIFADHRMTNESLAKSIEALKPPPPLPPVKENA